MDGSAVAEDLFDQFQCLNLGDGILVAALCRLTRAVETLLDGCQIGERQFEVDRLPVANRIDLTDDVHDIRIFETAYDVDDRVRLADIGKKLVSKSFTLRCALDEAGNVDKLDDRRDDILRFDQSGELLESRVWYLDGSDIRVDSAERKIGSLCLCRGQCVEKRRFTDIGQTDDTCS